MVLTNGGYYAKVQVAVINANLTVLYFTTYAQRDSGAGPLPKSPQNKYSYLAAGFPNYGIAPGSVFIIQGEYMSGVTTPVLQSSAGEGLPVTLDGTSVSVTVSGGAPVNCPLYYVSESQIAAVMPSSITPGNAAITVTYNGVPSLGLFVTVVAGALGFDTYYGNGVGLAAATDPQTGGVFFYNNSTSPGQTITLWGSGLGADPADSDSVFTSTPHAINVPLTIYIGGIQAQIQYQGASGYPGLNQINVTIPTSVEPGCGVSIVAVSGTMISNTVSIPVNPGGGTCSDPVIGTSVQLASKSSYNFGSVTVVQTENPAQAQATAVFTNVTGAAAGTGGGVISMGNCSEAQVLSGTNSTGVTTAYLGAGSITMNSPAGAVSLNEQDPGYFTLLPASILSTGGAFEFNGSGGGNLTPPITIGPFTVTVSYANPLFWTSPLGPATITRSQGLTVNWTGGDPNSYVLITGTSNPLAVAGVFSCYVPVGAGAFTVPAYVLSAMPAGSGTLTVENVTTPVTFAATGLDYASGTAVLSRSISATYQ